MLSLITSFFFFLAENWTVFESFFSLGFIFVPLEGNKVSSISVKHYYPSHQFNTKLIGAEHGVDLTASDSFCVDVEHYSVMF